MWGVNHVGGNTHPWKVCKSHGGKIEPPRRTWRIYKSTSDNEIVFQGGGGRQHIKHDVTLLHIQRSELTDVFFVFFFLPVWVQPVVTVTRREAPVTFQSNKQEACVHLWDRARRRCWRSLFTQVGLLLKGCVCYGKTKPAVWRVGFLQSLHPLRHYFKAVHGRQVDAQELMNSTFKFNTGLCSVGANVSWTIPQVQKPAWGRSLQTRGVKHRARGPKVAHKKLQTKKANWNI